MTLEEKLRSKHQGFPGLGVDASVGNDGRNGRSIYVGHVKDFFEGIFLTEDEKGYIRIKKQKQYRLPENNQFYYKSQSNFYRALVDEVRRMTTFSIYNLHGMYVKPGKNPRSNLEQGAYDFSRFGWSLDLHYLIQNYNSEAKDANVARFKDWLRSKTTSELDSIDEKLFLTGTDGSILMREIENRTTGQTEEVPEPYFKYMSLNRSVIDDPSYSNPHSIADFENAVFPVSIADGEDDHLVDYQGVDYLKQRRENQEMTNYNTKYTTDVLIPTTLDSKYKEGDILYIQDDITGQVISYIVVTADMVRCRYDYFLGKSTIPIKSLIYPFKTESERVQVFKNLIVTDFEIADSQKAYKNRAIDNFIKKHDNNYALSLMTNKESDSSLITMQPDTQRWLSVDIDDTRKFKIATTGSSTLRFSNLWLKDCWTNINIPEYFNENIILIDRLHVDNIDEGEFIEEYMKMRISSSKFFYSASEDSIFGIVITDFSTGQTVGKYEFTGSGSHEVSYVEDFSLTSGKYKIMAYASDSKTSTYWSEASVIELDLENKTHSYSKNDTVDEVIDVYDNDFFSFYSSNITCEDSEIEIDIEASDGCSINDIWINETNVEDLTNVSSWITCTSWTSDGSHAVVKLHITNNLPNDNNSDQTTIAEYLASVAASKRIGYKIQETSSRTAVITVTGTREDGQAVRTSHKVVQPGFDNPIRDINVKFSNIINNNAIERSNDSDNGVLCNQVQFFTEMTVIGFTSDTWGTYLENPRVYVYVNIDNDIDSDTDTDESNFNNVHFYSIVDKKKFPNNAVRAKFSWIPNTSKVTFDSSMWKIEEDEIEFGSYSYVFGDVIDSQHNNHEWVYFSDSSFLYSSDTQVPKDIIFRLDDDSHIGGLTLADVANETKVKIRTIAEVANPVPMEFNFKWKVEKVEVRGKVKRELTSLGPDDEDNREELVFWKNFEDADGFTSNPISENVKFVINPVYMTACPEDGEDIAGSKIGVAIMNIGSTEEPKVRVGIQDIDQEAKTEFFVQKRFDLAENRLKESRGNYHYVSDITNYWPKKRYFQDNIQSLYIKPRDFKSDVLNKTITKKNSPFVELIDALRPQESILQNMYNVALIDPSTSINEDFTKSFLMTTFNGYVMNPEYRNESLSFYYNNKLFQERLYDQWNSVSPIWIEQEVETELLDSSLLNAKQTWNYEYEVSKDYVPGKTRGGVITKSGYGYLEMDSEQQIETYDTGQYEPVGTLSLSQTISKSNEYALSDPRDLKMDIPTEFVNAPNPKEFFRTLIFDMKWIYPYYININNVLMIYPYYFSNSYESWLDMKVMEGYMETRAQDTLENLKRYIDTSTLFSDEDDAEKLGIAGAKARENYKKIKLDENLYMVKNDYILFEGNTEKTKVNMLIPYNVCYSVYPRTMYNTDHNNTINVFMLQQPTIVSDDNFSLNKHYFNVPPFNDDANEQAYYRENFEDGKQVVAPVLPPWYFNR